MSIRSKVLLMVLSVFALSAALVHIIARLVILPPFGALEREEAGKDVARAVDVLERDVQLLAPSVADWSIWDDLYRFVGERDPAFIDANLAPSTLDDLRVDYFAVYDRAGERVWASTREPSGGGAVRLGELDEPRLPEGHVLLCGDTTRERAGLYRAGEHVLWVAAHAILTSEGEGPSRGTVVMARFLDEAAAKRIAQQTRLAVSIQSIEGAAASAIRSIEGASATQIGRSDVALDEGPDVTRGSALLADLSGRPVVRVEVTAPRDISRRGEAAFLAATLSLLGSAVALAAAVFLILRIVVVRPIADLTRYAIGVGAHPHLRDVPALARKDELGVLAREFARMVERLAELRRSLVEQSYHSGVAEMASGVLHNIGNAITPLKVRVLTLADALQRPPLAELGLALDELEKGAAEPGRRRDLEQFARVATVELIETVRQAPEQLAAVARQVEHVQEILSDQEKFSRAARAVEPVSLAAVVAESLDLLGDDARSTIAVGVDASVKRAGPVLAARVALQQIVNNLLVNAREAIERAGRSGRIAIEARTESSDGRAFVQLRVADDGVGIAPEHLSRLFERGFTTKARGSSGIGLHWCALTVNALEGRLFAESAGFGRGARFTVILPAAPGDASAGA